MSSKRTAQLGLFAAVSVFALCTMILVRGTRDLTPPPLGVGERIPVFSLPDAFGHNTVLPTDDPQFLVLVFAPSGSLDHVQRAALEELADSLRCSTPVRFVGVADQASVNEQPTEVFSHVHELLVDQHRTIAALMGCNGEEPFVCLIDPDGVLRHRMTLSDDGMALRPPTVQDLRIIRDVVNESSPAPVAIHPVAARF